MQIAILEKNYSNKKKLRKNIFYNDLKLCKINNFNNVVFEITNVFH